MRADVYVSVRIVRKHQHLRALFRPEHRRRRIAGGHTVERGDAVQADFAVERLGGELGRCCMAVRQSKRRREAIQLLANMAGRVAYFLCILKNNRKFIGAARWQRDARDPSNMMVVFSFKLTQANIRTPLSPHPCRQRVWHIISISCVNVHASIAHTHTQRSAYSGSMNIREHARACACASLHKLRAVH